ncbi:DUF4180 domain-containing protein [Phenylobacterium koreense]|uniref:DUF4180 domain-containing protein n=1 Tax=Phenylobacterium koreense TaxID=266125 RepID=A0ABV2EMC0_9CAUL
MNQTQTICGREVLFWSSAGPPLSAPSDASDLVGEALSASAELIVIPVQRLSPDFLRLSTGLAGEVLQKCVNYGLRVAILGDVSSATAGSGPLRDFVSESNRGRSVWFVTDRADLEDKLARLPPSTGA